MGTRKPLPEHLTPRVWHVLDALETATPAEHAAGRDWYADAQRTAARIGPDIVTGAGVLAALSPQTSWPRNIELAERAFREDGATGQTSDNVSKANRILYGHASPLDVLGGNKVRAFYRAILDPSDPDPVVIDRHAFDVAIGMVTDNATRGILSRVGVYELYAAAYREAAHIAGDGLIPSQVQAITWVAWRRLKGIVD